MIIFNHCLIFHVSSLVSHHEWKETSLHIKKSQQKLYICLSLYSLEGGAAGALHLKEVCYLIDLVHNDTGGRLAG